MNALNPPTPRPGQRARFAAVFCALATVLFAALLSTGCQTNLPAPSASPASEDTVTNNLSLLHPGDVIKVAFEGDTNMNQIVKIQLEGFISLPLAGEVKAAGKTIDELKADLMARYKDLLKVNEISVSVYSKDASITVSGAVLKPGKIPMGRAMTVLDAIMEAGGYDPNRAKLSNVRVFRVEDGKQRQYNVNLQKQMSTGSEPFYLKPYDNIHVTEKRFNL